MRHEVQTDEDAYLPDLSFLRVAIFLVVFVVLSRRRLLALAAQVEPAILALTAILDIF